MARGVGEALVKNTRGDKAQSIYYGMLSFIMLMLIVGQIIILWSER